MSTNEFNRIYPSKFYDGQIVDKGLQIAIRDVLKYISPRSVVDVGCGIGCWLKVFKEHGIDGIGFDGPWVPKDKILIDYFNEIDLTKDSLPAIKADLVLCLEVAEHLSKERAVSLIAELTSIAPVVLFSAAIPKQGGTNHINEQWQSYWISIFEKNNYAVIDCIRPALWNNNDVSWPCKQNMFFFVDKSKLHQYQKLKDFKSTMPEDIVHPDLFGKEITIRVVIDTFLEIPKIVLKKIKSTRKRRGSCKKTE